MNLATQSQLNILIKEFKTLQTNGDSLVFEPKWRAFFETLDHEDAKIAIKAWFDAISENLSAIKKSVGTMSNEEKQENAGFFDDIKAHSFFQKKVANSLAV
jgi:hypothetical protein